MDFFITCPDGHFFFFFGHLLVHVWLYNDYTHYKELIHVHITFQFLYPIPITLIFSASDSCVFLQDFRKLNIIYTGRKPKEHIKHRTIILSQGTFLDTGTMLGYNTFSLSLFLSLPVSYLSFIIFHMHIFFHMRETMQCMNICILFHLTLCFQGASISLQMTHLFFSVP